MTVVPVAGAVATRAGTGVAASRAGAGKVVDAQVVKSRPLRGSNTRVRERASDAAGGAGLGQLLNRSPSLPEVSGRATGARRLLVAEFVVCMVVLAFYPLTGKSSTASAFMKRGSAIMGLFFVLGLVATAGRTASRAAAGFGGLVTLVLLISDRSIFTALAARFAPGVGEEDSDLGGLDAQDVLDDVAGSGVGVGEDVADAVGGVGGAAGNAAVDVAELLRRAVR